MNYNEDDVSDWSVKVIVGLVLLLAVYKGLVFLGYLPNQGGWNGFA